MPRMVSEITSGSNFEYSMDEGSPAITSARVFRILKNSPDESISLTDACSVSIGSEHPRIPGIYCFHFSGAYEGESRMSILATFDYRLSQYASTTGGGEDPGSYEPDIRPAKWSTSTSLMEVPAYSWDIADAAGGVAQGNAGQPVVNPVGDQYDGVTKLVPVVTITVEQWERQDPTRNNEHAGKINSTAERIGSLNIPKYCLMFRGVQTKPAVESWGNYVYRGWHATYEFLYKQNRSKFSDTDGRAPDWEDVGWDILQPVSGFNCRAFAPPGNAPQDPWGQPLKWREDDASVIQPPEGALSLPDGVAANEKVRAQVKVGVRGGKAGQRPSAQPIPLNADGTPRLQTANPKVLIYRHRVAETMNFRDLGLRIG